MSSFFIKYFTISLLVLITVLNVNISQAQAEVCITDKDTVDLITLLDASERDLSVMSSCDKLAKDLYSQLNTRDKKIVTITKDLIGAKQDIIKYKQSSEKWRSVAIYTGLTGVIVVLVQALPVL